MTLDILEGTSLDLGPNFWAVVVLVALVVIEAFQLGPHWFAASKKEKKGKSTSSIGTPTSKRDVPGVSGPRKRHRHGPINKTLFRDCVVNVHYFGERDHALLYLGPGGEELELCPKPPDHVAVGSAQAGGTEAEVAPPPNERGNYVIAWGEDPEVIVLKQLLALWSACVGKDRSDAKYLVLYCSKQPSTYAVQCIADELQGYTDRVGVSMLYEVGEKEEGEGVEEMKEHLKKAGITMSKID